MQKKWAISVDRNIIGVLSQSTYDNFPRAIKELITNSYDADADRVSVKVNAAKESFIIEDNGSGMNEQEFSLYLRIAGKRRQKEREVTPKGRKIIGQFGVGFLSVFPFFKSYQIETKKKGTDEVLVAHIPLSRFFSEHNASLDVGQIPISGDVVRRSGEKALSYTKITLTGFNAQTKAFFKPSKVVEKQKVWTYPGLDKLKWILSDDLPLQFDDDRLNSIFKLENEASFLVTINDEILIRKVFGTEILETQKGDVQQIGKIKFRYCILTPRRSVTPYNARFIKIRNYNVGVGSERVTFGEGEGRGVSRSRLHWLTGELHIVEGMNQLIKVSRDDFNYSEDYEELRSYMLTRLRHHATKLETWAELVKQTGPEFKVTDIRLIDPKNIQKKIASLKQENEIDASFSEGLRYSVEDNAPIINFTGAARKIRIGGKQFTMSPGRWDYQDDDFPACKIRGKNITINTAYPLFAKRKFTDFLKLHLLLLFNLNEGKISKKLFREMTQDVLVLYEDYLP